jgi:hypothetical protein
VDVSALLPNALRLAILLLAVRVVVDMATPESPGAFRLDPDTSVKVAAAPIHTIVGAGASQPLPTFARATTGRLGGPQRSASRLTSPARTFLPLTLHLAESTGAPPAADDD